MALGRGSAQGALLVCIVAGMLVAGGLGLEPEKMRVKDLMKVLRERGVECVGCSEKSHLVEMVRSTEGVRRRAHGMRGDPNDWVHQSEDRYRFDPWTPVSNALSWVVGGAARLLWGQRLLLAALAVPGGWFWLKHSHRTGKHNDVPFRQYLRFLGRRGAKAALGWGETARRLGLTMGGGTWSFLRARTRVQLAHTVLAASVFAGCAFAGFAAVGFLLVGFYIVFANLGRRKKGQGSAYSVFNGFRHLDGELRMEQVEAEIMHRPLNMRGQREGAYMLEGDGGADPSAYPRAPAPGRNDKVEVVGADGDKRQVKFKVLQQALDGGCVQVEKVRYSGVRYRPGSIAGGGGDDE